MEMARGQAAKMQDCLSPSFPLVHPISDSKQQTEQLREEMFASLALRSSSPAGPSKSMFKITLTRSSIGLPPSVRATVTALGFKKRMQSVYRAVNPKNVGRIVKIKELVKVQTLTPEQVWEETKPRVRAENSGYTVVGRAL